MVATAEPIRALAGQLATPGTHAFDSRLRSMPIAGGRSTSAIAVAACPAGTVITACSGANAPRRVLPRAPIVASRRGANGRPSQSVA